MYTACTPNAVWNEEGTHLVGLCYSDYIIVSQLHKETHTFDIPNAPWADIHISMFLWSLHHITLLSAAAQMVQTAAYLGGELISTTSTTETGAFDHRGCAVRAAERARGVGAVVIAKDEVSLSLLRE